MIATVVPVGMVPIAAVTAPALFIVMRPDCVRSAIHRRRFDIDRRTERQANVQVRMGLGGSNRTECKTGDNEHMGDDTLHGVSPGGRRVSHESNLRNRRLTSIDELLLIESIMKSV
jgi:hypothetical protein